MKVKEIFDIHRKGAFNSQEYIGRTSNSLKNKLLGRNVKLISNTPK